jgi:peptide-methionine (S)-S-oxide reductase
VTALISAPAATASSKNTALLNRYNRRKLLSGVTVFTVTFALVVLTTLADFADAAAVLAFAVLVFALVDFVVAMDGSIPNNHINSLSPLDRLKNEYNGGMEIATLAGGCFWCTEALFNQVRGVEKVVSGYSGGHVDNPTYDMMHVKPTGHAEAVHITFDPKVISYQEILEIFYATHDPTTLNRQGNDVGEEYRSAIFYHDDQQRQIAESVTNGFAKDHWDDPIVTEIVPLTKFWSAEDYHQDFYQNNLNNGYCQIIINPKLQKFRAAFADKLKA